MNNSQVAQAFASGKTSGRGSNLFIEGDTIYSYGYHFPIAKRTGINTVNFTTRGYSQSTSVHKGKVHSALLKAGFQITDIENPNT